MTALTFELNRIKKRSFDPNSEEDLSIYRHFLKTSSWGPSGCPFIIEPPFISIPDMINDRLVRHFLGVNNE